MKYIIVLLFLSLSISGHSMTYSEMAGKIRSEYAREVKKTKGLDATGFGGSMLTCVRIISIDFLSNQKVDVDEARKIYVDLVEGFARKINADKKIRIYLHDFPFTWKNTLFTLSFQEKNGKKFADHLSFIFMAKEKIYYCIYNEKTQRYDDYHIEYYTDALLKINSQE